MNNSKKICIVIAVKNRIKYTDSFIENFSKSSYTNFTIVVFDDGSTDGTSNFIKEKYKDVVVINGDGDNWWSASTNAGVEFAIKNNFDFVLTINDDSIPDEHLLKNLILCADKNPGSLIGARIMSDKSKIWALGVDVNFLKFPFLTLKFFGREYNKLVIPEERATVDALPGNGVLIPIAVFKKIGLYDSKWCPQYHGDTEFTFRAKQYGFNNFVCKDAVLENTAFIPDFNFSIWKELTSRKSPHYWRPVIKFYFADAPWYLKIFFFLQFLWIPKRILKTLIRKK